MTLLEDDYVLQCITDWRGKNMSTISVRLNEEEKKIFTEYAKLQGLPLSTLFKESLEKRMEDDLDIKMIYQYEKALAHNQLELYSHDEVKKTLGF